MAVWYNVNNDMKSGIKYKFNQLDTEDKDYIEDEYNTRKDSDNPMTAEEINSAVLIKNSKSIIKDRKAEWEKGKSPNQKTDPKRAKDYLDEVIGRHQNIIDQNKKAHPKSKFIQEARLSNEDWLKQADARQLTASSGMFGTDATYVDDTKHETTSYNPVGGLASQAPQIRDTWNVKRPVTRTNQDAGTVEHDV